jgi:MoaA/NifB/PqqE/SkfB family radical SAM enzyme
MAKTPANIAKLLALPGAVIGGITYKLGGILFIPRPRFVCFPVTFRCNSRCQMCNIWKNSRSTAELDLTTIERIFSHSLFRKVEQVVLHGGEPTLRKDVASIYSILLSKCHSLENITLSTNGLEHALVEKRVREILSVENRRRVQFTFTVSIDGVHSSHEAIRGVPGAFDRVVRTLEILKAFQSSHGIKIDIITVIQPQNLGDLENVMALAGRYGVGLIFQPLFIDTFYGNSECDPRLRFSNDQLAAYRAFINKHLAPGKSTRNLYWRNYLEMMGGGRRRIPCAYDRYVLSLYPTGEVLPCATASWGVFGNVRDIGLEELWFGREARRIRRRMRREVCPGCNFYCGAEYSLKKEFFTYALDVVKRSLSLPARTKGA